MILSGIDGANPLGFFAALGLLRLVRALHENARLGFLADGTCRAFLDGMAGDLAQLVADDAAGAARPQPWALQYEKTEKTGVKIVADLKPPPGVFEGYLRRCVARWSEGEGESVAFAAAFATSLGVDGKGNTKPTALHFTAANQKFLETVEDIRASVTLEWARLSLHEGHATRSGSNLRWDPSAERSWALMAGNPVVDGTVVDAPLEWLAFRALPFFPTFPVERHIAKSRIATTAVAGRGDDMRMTWPLWSAPLSVDTIRSLIHVDWTRAPRDRAERGIFAVCNAAIRRTAQGFGNFGPAAVTP